MDYTIIGWVFVLPVLSTVSFITETAEKETAAGNSGRDGPGSGL
jgi:hypothetical protein